MVIIELRSGLHAPVAGIENSDGGRFRLSVDEILEVAELKGKFRGAGFIDHNGELQAGLIALSGSKSGHISFIFSLVDTDVVLAQGRGRSVFRAERGDDRRHRNGSLGLSRPGRAERHTN